MLTPNTQFYHRVFARNYNNVYQEVDKKQHNYWMQEKNKYELKREKETKLQNFKSLFGG